ncbi:MAG: methyltransferase domain-containing protein [Bacteroidetes bacterium]|nr:methyltransferase domain-containing protein [Bacteroidota bacterium]
MIVHTYFMQTIFRKLTHKALSDHKLSGEIIDLGGTGRAEYAVFLKGSFKRYSVNMDEKSKPDFVADLEKPLKFESEKFNGALLINVLEHIYHAHQLVQETARVLKPGGTAIATIPYIMAIHPSPRDFYRFSDDALTLMFTEAGFTEVHVKPIGSGVFIARHMLLSRLVPHVIQIITEYPLRALAITLDKIWYKIAKVLRKKYSPADYPLGYIVTAKK